MKDNLDFQPIVMQNDLSSHIPHPACTELVDYLRRGRQTQTGEVSDSFEKKARFFLEMFNSDVSSHRPIHICSHSGFSVSCRHCCDRNSAVQKCTDALLELLMSCIPSVPTPNKWTTLFGPLEFVLGGCILHRWLPQVFKRAFEGMKFCEFDESSATLDPKLVEALSFHAVNGRRHASSLTFLSAPQANWSVAVLAITLEVNRCLTWYWLSCLGKSLAENCRPPLYSLLDRRTSIVIQALQHYASLLLNSEGNGRLCLLWASSQCESFQEFCEEEPSKVRVLRRMLLLGSGWVFRRHYVYLNTDPFTVTLPGDVNADPDMVDTVLQMWDLKHHCCVPPGICRDLKRKGVTSADLRKPEMRNALFWIAATMQCSMADVESLHSQNRNFAGSAFSSISAKFVSHESARFMEEASLSSGTEKVKSKKAVGSDGCVQSAVGNISIKDVSNKKTTPKALSALEIFRSRFLFGKRNCEGPASVVNPCSKEMWDEVRSAWAELSEAERCLYQSLASESKLRAASARAARKDGLHHRHDLAESGEPSGELVPVPDGAGPRPLQTQALPLSQVCDLISARDLETTFENLSQAAAASNQQDVRQFATGRFPLSEGCLEQAYRTQSSQGVTGKEQWHRFNRESERVARPPDDHSDDFPKKVQHEGVCGEQCRHFGDIERIRFHVNLLSKMQSLIAHKGGVKAAISADLLCV